MRGDMCLRQTGKEKERQKLSTRPAFWINPRKEGCKTQRDPSYDIDNMTNHTKDTQLVEGNFLKWITQSMI